MFGQTFTVVVLQKPDTRDRIEQSADYHTQPMRRNTILIVLLVTTVLLPMWYVALHGEPPSEEIAIDESVTDLRPLEGPIDTPNKLSPSQVGVVVWVALFGLVGVLAGAHQFMNRAVRPPEEAPVADGGQLTASLPWLESEHRWVVEYHDASDAVEAPALATDDDYETLAARYNDLFELGYSEYTDRTDGSLDSSGPPVPLYESKYRPDQSWNDVNLDLARAYDHYGLEIDQDRRDNHDALRYELEFAGYLA